MKIGILGGSFMGGVHAKNWQDLGHEITALADRDPQRREKPGMDGNIGADQVANLENTAKFAEYTELLKQVGELGIETIDVCLPSFLHREAVVAAMQTDVQAVICEKPMALRIGDAMAMVEASRDYEKNLYMAQCIRFWPEYQALTDIIRSNELGKLSSLSLTRHSAPPTWSPGIVKEEKTGGVVMDLLLHDIDYAHAVLGAPNKINNAVGYTGGVNGSTGLDCVICELGYDDDQIVMLDGRWDRPSGFKMAYEAVFERGKVTLNSATGQMYIERQGKAVESRELSSETGWLRELKHFSECIGAGKPSEIVTPRSSANSVALAVAIKKAAGESKPVPYNPIYVL